MKNILRKRYDLLITEAGRIYTKTFDLDKIITHITGILITSDRDDLLYYRGSQRLEVSKVEIFPEGYESKLLMTGINVSPDDRYFEFTDLAIGNGAFKIDYLDTDDARVTFEPYRVSFYLQCIAT